MHIPAEIFQGHFPAEEMGWSLAPKTLQKTSVVATAAHKTTITKNLKAIKAYSPHGLELLRLNRLCQIPKM